MVGLHSDWKEKKPSVVVAMSGGVDSSVAAALLKREGYDVVGMMLRLWSEPARGPEAPLNRCCTPDQMADARRVADALDIPFYVVDVKDFFRRRIVQFYIDEHARGRTPNPCVACNREIRFGFLLDRARALGADYLATGHYARVEATPEGYRLLRATDPAKDQSYVLHVLGQDELAQVLFPVGAYTKSEVREMAAAMGLPVARKQESMDLCFLGDGDYRRFLREYAPQAIRPGPIVNSEGAHLGEHNGLPFYTIGQRKGLGISASEPLYVLRKDASSNTLVVGSHAELGQTTLLVRDVNWVAGAPPAGTMRGGVKVRYKAPAVAAQITPLPDGGARVLFDSFVYGATPGQAAVFYDGEVVVGGGLIADAQNAGESEREELAIVEAVAS
ncbi:MAG: tRNA 2-thiouridine(34) synthase MnmA, partial [Anaerolineae bacterium]|nr:tRNA 2-thiouridine(34) synthase MnmA [Anaerolineae bacterium]